MPQYQPWQMKKIYFLLPVILITACSPLKKYADTRSPWETEVQKLEQLDQQESYPDDAILFLGSSSIRLWKNIKEDMAPYTPIRRGYGGAHFTDLIHFTDRLSDPHKFQAIVLFVANDITGGDKDLEPKEVESLFKFFIKQVRAKHPITPVFYIQVTPTNSRWTVWDKIQEGNNLIKNYCQKHDNLYFIETAENYLGADGKPIADLFIQDQLHMKQAGYDIWKRVIKAELDKVLKK